MAHGQLWEKQMYFSHVKTVVPAHISSHCDIHCNTLAVKIQNALEVKPSMQPQCAA